MVEFARIACTVVPSTSIGSLTPHSPNVVGRKLIEAVPAPVLGSRASRPLVCGRFPRGVWRQSPNSGHRCSRELLLLGWYMPVSQVGPPSRFAVHRGGQGRASCWM
jgi:hypothetical protein